MRSPIVTVTRSYVTFLFKNIVLCKNRTLLILPYFPLLFYFGLQVLTSPISYFFTLDKSMAYQERRFLQGICATKMLLHILLSSLSANPICNCPVQEPYCLWRCDIADATEFPFIAILAFSHIHRWCVHQCHRWTRSGYCSSEFVQAKYYLDTTVVTVCKCNLRDAT